MSNIEIIKKLLVKLKVLEDIFEKEKTDEYFNKRKFILDMLNKNYPVSYGEDIKNFLNEIHKDFSDTYYNNVLDSMKQIKTDKYKEDKLLIYEFLSFTKFKNIDEEQKRIIFLESKNKFNFTFILNISLELLDFDIETKIITDIFYQQYSEALINIDKEEIKMLEPFIKLSGLNIIAYFNVFYLIITKYGMLYYKIFDKNHDKDEDNYKSQLDYLTFHYKKLSSNSSLELKENILYKDIKFTIEYINVMLQIRYPKKNLKLNLSFLDDNDVLQIFMDKLNYQINLILKVDNLSKEQKTYLKEFILKFLKRYSDFPIYKQAYLKKIEDITFTKDNEYIKESFFEILKYEIQYVNVNDDMKKVIDVDNDLVLSVEEMKILLKPINNNYEITAYFLDYMKKLYKFNNLKLLENLNILIEDYKSVKTTEEILLEIEDDKKDDKKKSKKKKSKKKSKGGGELTLDELDSKFEELGFKGGIIDDIIPKKLELPIEESKVIKIRTDFFKETQILFDKVDKAKFFMSSFNMSRIYTLIIFNYIKDYLIYIISLTTSDKILRPYRTREIIDDTIRIGKLILQGGACVQYYSDNRRKTYDLDYKFYPDSYKNEESKENLFNLQLNFLKKFVLPYISTENINITNILNKSSIDETSELTYWIDNLKKKEFRFSYEYDEERGIIKVFVNFYEKTHEYKLSILDISLFNKDDEKSKNLINSIDKSLSRPKSVDIKIDDLSITILEKEYLKSQLTKYIEDKNEIERDETYEPKFIAPVKNIKLNETVKFLGKKAEEQLKALEKIDGKRRYKTKTLLVRKQK